MDQVQKTRFERMTMIPLVAILALTVFGAMKNTGMLWVRRLATPLPVPATPVAPAPTTPKTTGARPSLSETARPEYTALSFRDPLVSLLPNEPVAVAASPRLKMEPQAGAMGLPALAVQGMIWGGSVPQVVINGRVYTIGDDVEGARITAIDHRGVTVELNGRPVQLTTSTPEMAGVSFR